MIHSFCSTRVMLLINNRVTTEWNRDTVNLVMSEQPVCNQSTMCVLHNNAETSLQNEFSETSKKTFPQDEEQRKREIAAVQRIENPFLLGAENEAKPAP